MGSRDSLLVALVAAVGGLGVGYLFASLLQGPPPVEASGLDFVGSRALQAQAPSEPAPVLDELARDVQRTPAVVPVQAPIARVPEAELERALDAIVAPSVGVARGVGAITGEVLDVAGTPLQGAVVVCSRMSSNSASDPASVGTGPPEEESLEDYLRKFAEYWAESRAGRRRAVTDADGRFEFTGLVESASYRLNAYLEDHVLEAEGSAYSVSPGQRVIFRAQGVHVIPVQLVYEDGRQPTEGLVGVKRGDNESYYKWSADSPDLRLTAGRVGVRGYAGMQRSENRGGVDSSHGSEEISVDVADQAGAPLELVLKARGGIRGRVVDDFGTTRNRLMVRLLSLPAGAELDESALAESDRYVWPRGDRFHFLDLAPGPYAVGLASWNEALVAHALVTVGEGVVDVEVVIPEPDPEGHLVVRAFGPSGNPLQDLDFRWKSRNGGGSRSGGIQDRRAQDGAYWLRPKAEFFEAWGSETSYTLTIQHAELGEREIHLEEGQRLVTVTFEEPVTLLVVVAGYAGSGYEGKLQVGLTPVVADGEQVLQGRLWSSNRRRGEGQFSAEGIARLDGLAPGLWRVRLEVKTGEWRTRTVGTVEVRVTSGEKTVPMDLPALYDLVVIAPGQSKDSRLYLRRTGEGLQGVSSGRAFNSQIGSDGRAVFDALVAGDYTLTGNGAFRPVDVTIPCGAVYLDIKSLDCLRVAIGDLEGALYKAGLRAGDLIIGVDGEEFESAPNTMALFRGEGEVSLTVLRDGGQLQLSMKRVSAGGGWFAMLGGMLMPASRP